MKQKLVTFIKSILKSLGFKLSKISGHSSQDENPFIACASTLFNNQKIIIFDIGMNHGQTLNKIKESIPQAYIHGFESSKYCYKDLQGKFNVESFIKLNNLAIGDVDSIMQFNEYSWDAMNSFLTRAYGTAQIVETYDVQVITVDTYCHQNNIDHIHILKSDTEGFELKVLQGASNMLSQNKIKFVLIELFFDLNFNGQSSVGELFSFLEKNNFSLVRFYDFGLTADGLASKSDALFVNSEFK